MHFAFKIGIETWFDQRIFIAHTTEALLSRSILKISHGGKYRLQVIFHLFHERYSVCHFPEKFEGTKKWVRYLSSPLICSGSLSGDRGAPLCISIRRVDWEQGGSIMHPSPSCPLCHARVHLINQTWPGYSSAKMSSIAPVSCSKIWLTRLSMPTPPATWSQQANSSQAKLLVIPPKAASYLYAIAHADCSARNALFYPCIFSGGGGVGR